MFRENLNFYLIEVELRKSKQLTFSFQQELCSSCESIISYWSVTFRFLIEIISEVVQKKPCKMSLLWHEIIRKSCTEFASWTKPWWFVMNIPGVLFQPSPVINTFSDEKERRYATTVNKIPTKLFSFNFIHQSNESISKAVNPSKPGNIF